MYQPVALFIGLRYMRGRASTASGGLFPGFPPSALRWGDGVGHRAVGDERFREGSGEQHPRPDAAGVGHQSAGSVNPQQLPASEMQKLQGVTRVAPLTTGDVVLQSARSVAVGVMLGVNPDEADPLTRIWSTSSSNSCSRANTTSSSANSWRGNSASSAAIRCA